LEKKNIKDGGHRRATDIERRFNFNFF